MRIQLNARNRAYHFEANPGARVLYSGLAAGINLPYECGSGTCGTCKARLIEGEIDDLWPEAAGRKYLKQAGEFLMCQCVARNDCTVEVANFVYNMDPGACIPGFRDGTIRRYEGADARRAGLFGGARPTGGFRRRAVRGDAGARACPVIAATRW